MSYFLALLIFTAFLIAIAFLAIASRQKDKTRRRVYFFWGLAFLFAEGWDTLNLLHNRGILALPTAEYLSIFSWTLFLIFLYCGTIFIFTKRVFVNLTYLLFIPALILLLLSPLFFAQPASLVILGGFFVIIPLQMMLGILSWFLGLSLFRDPNALFAYWMMGAAWFLHSVEVGLSSVLHFLSKEQTPNLYNQPTISYIGYLAQILLLASFVILLMRRWRHGKELI